MQLSIDVDDALSLVMDQDRAHTPTGHNSLRVGSVWDGRKQEEGVVSPNRKKAEENKLKRQQAAVFIKEVTGADIPYSKDNPFRTSLRDGVILCKLLQKLRVDVGKVIETPDHPNSPSGAGKKMMCFENVQNFITAVKGLQVPSDCLFSVTDLESDGWEERPRVADCILWLQRLWQQVVPSPFPAPTYNDLPLLKDSPRKQAVVAGNIRQPSFGSPTGSVDSSAGSVALRPAHSSPTNPTTYRTYSSSVNINTQSGISKLLQTCTGLLNDRMGVTLAGNSGVGTVTSEAVGPVLETVLSGLTQEYERRLFQKDQEISSSRADFERANRQLQSLEKELLVLQSDAQDKRELELQHSALSNNYHLLNNRMQELDAVLQDQKHLCAQYEMRLQSHALVTPEEVEQMQARIDELSALEEEYHVIMEKYEKVKEDNKALYNTVLDLKGSIRVYCRVRPPGTTGMDEDACISIDENNLAIFDHQNPDKVPQMFKFDRIFDMQSTQEDVYEDTQPLVRSVLDGYNVCIFAYGQTGSGKTHTMTGHNVNDPMQRGINYRTLEDLFTIRETREGEVDYTIQVQMLEIYNENLRDLLADDQTNQNKHDILATQASGCNVPTARKEEVQDATDVIRIMAKGSKNRHFAATNMNERSSRSHQVLTVIVDGINRATGARSHGCLNLVDLAGSERTDKSGASGDRMKEANCINKSLSTLGLVMTGLANKQHHVNFRDSKLTQLLQDSLGGNAKVMMFMHIAPEVSSYSESVSTLKFGSNVSNITLGQARKNTESGRAFQMEGMVAKMQAEMEHVNERYQHLRHENRELREALARKEEVERMLRAELEKYKSTRVSMESLQSNLSVDSTTRQLPRAHTMPHQSSFEARQPSPEVSFHSVSSNFSAPSPTMGVRATSQATPRVASTPRGSGVIARPTATPRAGTSSNVASTPRGSTAFSLPTPRGGRADSVTPKMLATTVTPPPAAEVADVPSTPRNAANKAPTVAGMDKHLNRMNSRPSTASSTVSDNSKPAAPPAKSRLPAPPTLARASSSRTSSVYAGGQQQAPNVMMLPTNQSLSGAMTARASGRYGAGGRASLALADRSLSNIAEQGSQTHRGPAPSMSSRMSGMYHASRK